MVGGCLRYFDLSFVGVVALVDVRGQCENRFRGIAREVEKLGGKVGV